MSRLQIIPAPNGDSFGLIETFDIVDRSVLELALTDAEGFLTLQVMCLSGNSIYRANLISADLSLLPYFAIGTNASASEVAASINIARNDATIPCLNPMSTEIVRP